MREIVCTINNNIRGSWDPGNLGTIFRTAEGAGVSSYVSRNSVDIYNPKTIRSTMGSIYRMPFIYVEDLSEIMDKLKNHGIRTYGSAS